MNPADLRLEPEKLPAQGVIRHSLGLPGRRLWKPSLPGKPSLMRLLCCTSSGVPGPHPISSAGRPRLRAKRAPHLVCYTDRQVSAILSPSVSRYVSTCIGHQCHNYEFRNYTNSQSRACTMSVHGVTFTSREPCEGEDGQHYRHGALPTAEPTEACWTPSIPDLRSRWGRGREQRKCGNTNQENQSLVGKEQFAERQRKED